MASERAQILITAVDQTKAALASVKATRVSQNQQNLTSTAPSKYKTKTPRRCAPTVHLQVE